MNDIRKGTSEKANTAPNCGKRIHGEHEKSIMERIDCSQEYLIEKYLTPKPVFSRDWLDTLQT